jgi:hypothetical protein
MANAIRLDIPTLCWSNADLHEPPLWLMQLGGGWVERAEDYAFLI